MLNNFFAAWETICFNFGNVTDWGKYIIGELAKQPILAEAEGQRLITVKVHPVHLVHFLHKLCSVVPGLNSNIRFLSFFFAGNAPSCYIRTLLLQIFFPNLPQQQNFARYSLSNYIACNTSICPKVCDFDIIELKFLSLHEMPDNREICRIIGVAAGESLFSLYRIIMVAFGLQEVWETIESYLYI